MVKKRKLETIKESEVPDQTDGKQIDESLNELIIETKLKSLLNYSKKHFQKRLKKLIVKMVQCKTLYQKSC